MRYLVDTHALIWYLESNPRLSVNAKFVLEDRTAPSYVSLASIWEMAIKISLGRFKLQTEFLKIKELLIIYGFEFLPVQFEHLMAVSQMPFHHNDPFDRLLIAQSKVEELILITKDEKFNSYNIETLW